MAGRFPGESRRFGRAGRGGRGGAGLSRSARIRRNLRLSALGLSLAVLATSGISSCAYHTLTAGLSTSNALRALRLPGGLPSHDDGSVNVLLIGLDSRKDQNGNDLPKQFVADELHAGSSEIGGYNTNTLILLHIPAGGGKAQAFSIPRDDYVETYGSDGSPRGMHKIKEAYGRAKAAALPGLRKQGVTGAAELERRSREAGREATLATVQNLLGLRIDHFAEVNLLGFYDVAKVLQPITVCLKHATKDPAIDGQGSGADFRAGLNTLDASQALSFVRQRHNLTGGDLDRTRRQQAFLASVELKLKRQGVLDDIGKLQSLLDVVKKDVVVDSGWDVLDFALRHSELSSGNLEFHTLPVAGFATRGGESVNLVDPARLRALVARYTGESAPASASPSGPSGSSASSAGTPGGQAVVDVLNGSGKRGAAADASSALAALGYRRGWVGNAAPTRGTRVSYGSGARAAAEAIAERYGVTAVPAGPVPAGHVQVVLGRGGTGLSARAAVPTGTAAPSASSAPATGHEFYGSAVKMGGIPCVD